jgi:hypothetical protein
MEDEVRNILRGLPSGSMTVRIFVFEAFRCSELPLNFFLSCTDIILVTTVLRSGGKLACYRKLQGMYPEFR